MKYQRKTLDAGDRRLNWFDSDKYSGLEKLSSLGWYFQILVRRELLKRLDSQKDFVGSSPKRLMSEQINCVRRVPIVTLKSLRDSGVPLKSFHYLSVFLAFGSESGSVTPITLGEMIEDMEALLTFIESSDSLERTGNHRPEGRSWVSPSLIERGFARRGELKYKYSSLAVSELLPGAVELLHLDLGAPDRVLTADFKDLLNSLRSSRQVEMEGQPYPELDWTPTRRKSNSERPWSIDSRRLLDGKVIQFLDLIIWERQEHLTISPLAKASLLFEERRLQRKTRRSIRSVSTRKTVSEGKKANNRLATTETNAFVAVNPDHFGNYELIASASKELEQSYRNARRMVSSRNNSEFVPSETERLALRRQFDEL